MEQDRIGVKLPDISRLNACVGSAGAVLSSRILITAASVALATTREALGSELAPISIPRASTHPAEAPDQAANVLAQVFDLLPQAIIVVRHDYRVLYWNAAANSLLKGTSCGLPSSAGLALSSEASSNSRLWAAVVAVLAADPTDDALVHLVSVPRRPPGRSLTAIIRRLEDQQSDAPANHALVIVTDPVHQVERAIPAAARRYGLTKAEAQLAEAVALGICINDYAQQRDISLNTVKTQLKHVLAKTGRHRQAELVGLILGIPVTLV